MLPITPSLGRQNRDISRRDVLTGLGSAVVLAAPVAGHAQALVREGTPQLTFGPMYPLNRPAEEDGDLTRLFGHENGARGQVIEVFGRVLDMRDNPVAFARMDMWQTNAAGRYLSGVDRTSAPHDPDFQYAAVIRADANGNYRIRSVLPAPYESRQRHIHWDVSGQNRRLITQMFFPGEPNERDRLFTGLNDGQLQQAVTARRTEDRNGAWQFAWDIVLAGE